MMKGFITRLNNQGTGGLLASPFSSPQPAADRAPADSSAKSTEERRRSLLVVEDNPSTRILLVYMLRGAYDVTAAAGVDEAMTLVGEKHFHGLVLDINLCEERTGVDLLHAIRALPQYKSVPAIACTAYTSYGDRKRLLESGFDRYVAKPFTKEHLREALAHLFDPTASPQSPEYEA